MADYHYDIGSYHPLSEARTFHSEGRYARTTASSSSPRTREHPSSTKFPSSPARASPLKSPKSTGSRQSKSRHRSRSTPKPFYDEVHHDYRQEPAVDPRAYSDRRSDDLLLTWRLDPEESLSDWTIVVRTSANKDFEEGEEVDDDSEHSSDNNAFSVRYYYVHKTQLGVGPRRSEYFARLFRSKRSGNSNSFDNTEEQESRIELKPSAAAAFPLLLDYMYSPPGVPVNVSTKSAVALRHLATCFGIRDLFSEVTAFIHQDLNVNTSLIYLKEAGIYNHEKLLGAAVKLCAANLEALKLSHLVTLEPRVFQQIVTSPACVCKSEILSSRVSSYIRCRPGSFNLSFLKSVTSLAKMPRIAPEEALFFLSVLAQLGVGPGASNTILISNSEDDDVEAVEEETGPTLYERCASSAVDALKRAVSGVYSATNASKSPKNNHPAASIKSLTGDYQSLPANMKIDLLERSILRQSETTPSIQEDFGASIENSTLGREDVKQLKKSFSKKIEKYKSMLESKKEEVRVYAEEFSKFQRVPITYRAPPLLMEYTFKENQEYDRYGQSIYGSDPPTALPRIGEHEMDGWMLKEEKWTENGLDTRNWPIFYYKAN